MFPFSVCTRQSPRLVIGLFFHAFKGNRLHHLSHRTVGKNHRGHTVLIRQIKAFDGQARHLLHRRRRENNHMVIPMTAALGRLKIVGLRRLNAAESRTAALHIDNERGQVAARYVRKPFCFQRNTGT